MFNSHAYRYENEQLVLFLTILLVLGVIIFTSTATFCLSGVFIVGMFGLSALMNRTHHRELLSSAYRVNQNNSPELANLVYECGQKLQPDQVDVFMVKHKQLNAYTFGMNNPKALVLFSPMLKVMNTNELRFIIGHEMGHVALGHTWVNTILGGMAGIPASFGAAVLLYTAFRWWNRMCEYSADRAGLLACGDINTAISALIKLVAPNIQNQAEFEHALKLADAEDDSASNKLAELFQTHPMIIRRINALREYARTAEYHTLQARMNQNLEKHPAAAPPSDKNIQQKPVTMHVLEPELKPEERWPWLKPKAN